MTKYLSAFLSITIFTFCMTCSNESPTRIIPGTHQYVEISDAINDLYTYDTIDTMYYNFIDIKRAGISSNDTELICTLVVAGFPDTLWLKNISLYGDTIHGAPHWRVYFDFWNTPLIDDDIVIDTYFSWIVEKGRPDFLTSLKTNYWAAVCLRMDVDNSFESEVRIPVRLCQFDSILVIHYSDPALMVLEKDIAHSDIYIESYFRDKRDEVSLVR